MNDIGKCARVHVWIEGNWGNIRVGDLKNDRIMKKPDIEQDSYRYRVNYTERIITLIHDTRPRVNRTAQESRKGVLFGRGL